MTTYSKWCVVIVNTMILLFALDIATTVYARWRDYHPSYDPEYCQAPALQLGDRTWCNQYVLDNNGYSWTSSYRTYTMFRPEPRKSPTINVDQAGIRDTPGNDPEQTSTKIFMFGGSTMLGVGVADGLTIPSYLLQALKKEFPNRQLNVLNYGAGWWVSTQSVVQLVLELRNGHRPDVVVFYDGINDLDVVTMDPGGVGRPGDIWPELREALARTVRPPAAPSEGIQLLMASAFLTRTQSFLRARLGRHERGRESVSEQDLQRAALVALDVYQRNVRFVETLSRAYGFKFFAFWQPSPLLLPSVDPCQNTGRERRSKLYPHEQAVYRDSYETMRTACKGQAHCTYLGDMFLSLHDKCPYIDSEHLGPVGNAQIAEAILKEIEPSIAAIAAPSRDGRE